MPEAISCFVFGFAEKATLSLDHYLYHSFSLFCSQCQEFIHISRGMRGLLDGSIVSTCLPCYSELHSSTLMQRQKYLNCQYNFFSDKWPVQGLGVPNWDDKWKRKNELQQGSPFLLEMVIVSLLGSLSAKDKGIFFLEGVTQRLLPSLSFYLYRNSTFSLSRNP